MPEPREHGSPGTEGLSRSSDFVMRVSSMRRIARVFVSLVIPLLTLSSCRSRQLTEEGIAACLARTDFTGHSADERAAIGRMIAYERKVRETTCCALEPRTGILARRHDLAAFRNELLQRIDILETQGPVAAPYSEASSDLRKNNPCYAALMDLYHDVNYAMRPPRR